MGTPSTHMSNVPSGSGLGVPGTALKANARTPTSPTNLPGSGDHPGLPKGSAKSGPKATANKTGGNSPLSG